MNHLNYTATNFTREITKKTLVTFLKTGNSSASSCLFYQFACRDRMICTLLSFFSLFSRAMAEARERTFIMVKPDGVQRGLVGKIIKRFEAKGFKLVAMKFMWVSNELH